MTPKLEPSVAAAVAPVFAALPPDKAMGRLVVPGPGDAQLVPIVEAALKQPALAGRDHLAAGLWLYVDQLDRSHKICQRHEGDPTGCFWHAIMHRLEGDFSNSIHWFRKADGHRATASLKPNGYDPVMLVRQAEAAHRRGETPQDLIAAQREEWFALFAWCSVNA